MTGRRLRVFIHAQHLSGVGHFVRMHALGRALAGRHAAWLTDGGRPVPRADHGRLQLLELPRIERRGGAIVPLEPALTAAQAMERRSAVLTNAVGELCPDLLVVEHFPFSKWALRRELEALIAAAHAANPAVRVACSVRDIPAQTSHEDCTPAQWSATVLESLHRDFDAVMVHGEEALVPLARSFPEAGAIRLPVAHTGFVAEEPAPAAAPESAELIASIGGGDDPAGLLAACLDAWRLLQAQGATGGRRLVLCAGLRGNAPGALPPGVEWAPFGAGFAARLARAALSVSYAGYNTCAGLLAARTRAVLVPNPRMSDQALRADVMATAGAAAVVPAAQLTPAALAGAMSAALAGPRPTHGIRVDGAARAVAFLESLARAA